MSKKRIRKRRLSATKRKYKRNKIPKDQQHSLAKLEDTILTYLYKSDKSTSEKEIAQHLLSKKISKNSLDYCITNLLNQQIIVRKKSFLQLHHSAPLYKGTFIYNPKGFGFVTPEKTNDTHPTYIKDFYIPKHSMLSSAHGDTVLIRTITSKKGKNTEGRILDILSFSSNKICGLFSNKGNEPIVFPDDPKFPHVIRVAGKNMQNIEEGSCVLVEYDRTSRKSFTLSGKVIQVLGDNQHVDTQMQMVIHNNKLPYEFSNEVIKEAIALKQRENVKDNRVDLRSVPHVTIDGDDAKDFDDAIAVERKTNGYRLYVSIADVSFFVRKGSELDKEAYQRGTSIYFPGRVLPMLPPQLSEDLCSLKPDKDRYTLTAVIDYDKNGTRKAVTFHRSIIRSHFRFTYEEVYEYLSNNSKKDQNSSQPYLDQLTDAEQLAKLLKKNRQKQGSIEFNIPEASFSLDSSGKVSGISVTTRNFAHQMIEEFMLAANEVVAEFISSKSMDTLFRVHPPPTLEKGKELVDFISQFNTTKTSFEQSPLWFSKLLTEYKKTKYEYVIHNLMLRTMQQAYYSTETIGHFGLALQNYCHFTSPIRRYPDLMVHRQLVALIEDQGLKKPSRSKASLEKTGTFLSARERVAIGAEREMDERLKLLYMQDKIGSLFSGIISGLNDSKLFVTIPTLSMSGSISFSYLRDDYYLVEIQNYRIRGQRSNTTYTLGDKIMVELVEANLFERRLYFKPHEPSTTTS